MSSIAQDELRKLSSRVKFGHQQAIKSNVVLGNSRIFGYTKEDKRLVIDESQAPMVRDLFRLYATGEYSMKQLETLFYDQGYRNYNGNKIAHTTMSGIISNPKYKGYYVGNKVRIVDMFTKKQKFLPPEEWVMFKDETGEIVPALVSEELWDKANEVLARRSEDVKNRQGICNHANLLTGKLFCTHCGAAYYRRESKSKDGTVNSKWVCSNKINNGADACPSFPIYEDEIKPILFEVFSETKVDVEALLETYTKMFQSLENDHETSKQIAEQKRIIELGEQKKNKLLELVTTGMITTANFKSMTDICDREIDEAKRALAELEEQLFTQDEYQKHMREIKTRLEAAVKDARTGLITNEFVAQYIDKIFVTMEENNLARLEIKIFTGKNTDKWLMILKGRTGHTMNFVNEYFEDYGRSPSTREIEQGIGASRPTIQRYLKTLQEQGEIEYDGHRGIITQYMRELMDTNRVQMGNSIPCGPLTEVTDAQLEHIRLPLALTGSGDFFLLRANGESMIGAGIDDGDLVLIRKQETAREGQIVAVLYNSDCTTLKRFHRESDSEIHLIPENDSMKPIVLKGEQLNALKIQGVATMVMKDLDS